MGDLNVFFNTKVRHSGALSAIGNFGLTPVRYLCYGKTFQMITVPGTNELAVSRIQVCPKNNFFRTITAVVLLVPGLILAIAKLASYIFANTRKDHQRVKECLLANPTSIRSFPRPTPPPPQPSMPIPPPIQQQPTPMELASTNDRSVDYIIYESRTLRNEVRTRMNELRTQMAELENTRRERQRRTRHRPMQIDG